MSANQGGQSARLFDDAVGGVIDSAVRRARRDNVKRQAASTPSTKISRSDGEIREVTPQKGTTS